MPALSSIFTGAALCAHPSCHWEVDGGWSGIEARYENDKGEPSCWSHRDEARFVDPNMGEMPPVDSADEEE